MQVTTFCGHCLVSSIQLKFDKTSELCRKLEDTSKISFTDAGRVKTRTYRGLEGYKYTTL